MTYLAVVGTYEGVIYGVRISRDVSVGDESEKDGSASDEIEIDGSVGEESEKDGSVGDEIEEDGSVGEKSEGSQSTSDEDISVSDDVKSQGTAGDDAKVIGDLVVNVGFSNKNHEGCIKSVAICGGEFLATSSTDATVCLYNVLKNQEAGRLTESKEYHQILAFDKYLMITVEKSGSIDIWDIFQWNKICSIDSKPHDSSENYTILNCCTHPTIRGVIMTFDSENVLRYWNVAYQNEFIKMTKLDTRINDMFWFACGTRFIIVMKKSVLLYSFTSKGYFNEPKTFDFDYNLTCQKIVGSEYCFFGGSTGEISFFSVKGGVIYSFKAHENRIKSIEILIDIHVLMSVDSSGSIKFWDLVNFVDQIPTFRQEFSIPFRPVCTDSTKLN